MSAQRLVTPPQFTPLTNAIRILAVDAIQKANSGHPGAPLGMAEIAEALWRHHLKHNPTNPKWINRDRFVLSNGHASMLLYTLLHLTGYDLSIEDLKNFRQLHSLCPGHPENTLTPGVETTTGPLGQGIANAVGMALSEKILADSFNRPNFPIMDHYTYAFVGDGCLMEGISHEVCSLAGTWGLGKLIVFYDDNNISIDGHIDAWFSDDTVKRFQSYNWQVIPSIQGHDPKQIQAAIEQAKLNTTQPTLICCKTIIGAGCLSKQDSASIHGAPLSAEENQALRKHIGWNFPPFEIPEDIYQQWDAKAQGTLYEQQWQKLLTQYQQSYPELAAEFDRRVRLQQLPENWQQNSAQLIHAINDKHESIATRKASYNCIEAIEKFLPELIGGSADLAGSNLTKTAQAHPVSAHSGGNYIYYGVREFGMVAIANGIALHGGLIPFTATFLMFSEYARNAIRMAALMKLRQIFVFTHDSIGLGEDGPTHQPIEQPASLRTVPNLHVWRPCDTVETAIAWQMSIERNDGPSALLFSRQNLAFQQRSAEQIQAIHRGGYVLSNNAQHLNKPSADVVIIATGSEVDLAMQAQAQLLQEHIAVQIVSMPCTQLFDQQDKSWKNNVLPPHIPRIAIEAGSRQTWYKYVGAADLAKDAILGIDQFGESAPAKDLFPFFGITVEAIISAVHKRLTHTH